MRKLTIESVPSRWRWWGLGLITVVGILRLHFLFRPAGYDEAYSYLLYASGPLSRVLGSYYPNNHILHTLSMAVSTSIFGSEPWALRIPALLAGIGCIPAAYFLGRRLHDEGAGLIAAALTAASSVLIEYSTNGRGYTMLALATLLLFTIGAGLLRERRAGWIAAGGLAALGLFTVPVMLFVVVAWNAWMVAGWLVLPERRSDKTFLPMLTVTNALMVLLTALLYMPAVLNSGAGAIVSNQWVRSLPLQEVVSALPRILAATALEPARDWPGAGLLFVLATTVIVFSRRGDPPARLLAPAILLSILAVVCAQRAVPLPRMLVPFVPLAYVLTGVGLSILGTVAGRCLSRGAARTALGAGALIWMIAVGLSARSSFPIKSETGTLYAARAIAAYLEGRLAPGDVILVRVPGNVPLYYYLYRTGAETGHVSLSPSDWLHRGLDTARRVYLVVNEPVETLEDVDRELGDLRARFAPPRQVAIFPHAAVFVREALPKHR